MKILFQSPLVVGRKEVMSHQALLHGCGFSGTEGALLEVAAYLARQGHEVHILGITANEQVSEGVFFWHQAQGLLEADPIGVGDIDWYCPIFYLFDRGVQAFLKRLNPRRTRVLAWFQCFIPQNELRDLAQAGFRVYAQFLSEYMTAHYQGCPYLLDAWVIGNALHPIFTQPLRLDGKRPGTWAFCAVHERGGEMAARVFKRVQARRPAAAQSMTFATYEHDARDGHGASGVTFAGSMSKTRVKQLLDETEYFVYPLVQPSGLVHHDTYGCVVLEALARGVIVLTWDVACMRDVYGDHVLRLPPPEEQGYGPHAAWGTNSRMLTEAAVEAFADAILRVEGDPGLKRHMQERGALWAHTQTWDKVGERTEACLLERLAPTS